MREQIQIVINSFQKKYGDLRSNVFNVELKDLQENTLVLTGQVLESFQIQELKEEIIKKLPQLSVNMEEVQVLRNKQKKYAWVATNLTSLHNQPDWLAEMVSQLLYGTRVEILIQKEQWVFIRQDDGYLGWAYLPYLSLMEPTKTTHLMQKPFAKLFTAQNKKSPISTRIYCGTAVTIGRIDGDWAFVEPNGDDLPSAMPGGWTPVDKLNPLEKLPKTILERRNVIIAAAFKFYGVPYLWGGCTANGIDCSGLAQLCHRLAGLQILRDADMQMEAGRKVEFPYQPGDLLFFGEDHDISHITHVGISLGGWEIIHSSRSRNGVHTDNVQNIPHLKDSFAGACTFLNLD